MERGGEIFLCELWLRFEDELLEQERKIHALRRERNFREVETGDLKKFVDQSVKAFGFDQCRGEITCAHVGGQRWFVTQETQITDDRSQGRFEIVSEVHDEVVFTRLGVCCSAGVVQRFLFEGVQ